MKRNSLNLITLIIINIIINQIIILVNINKLAKILCTIQTFITILQILQIKLQLLKNLKGLIAIWINFNNKANILSMKITTLIKNFQIKCKKIKEKLNKYFVTIQ